MSKSKTVHTTEGVVWENPPGGPQYDWVSLANMMRERPNEWLKIFTQGRTSVANAIRQGSVGDVHPTLGFEVMTRNNKRGTPRTCDLYLRYNPDKEQDLTAALREARKKAK